MNVPGTGTARSVVGGAARAGGGVRSLAVDRVGPRVGRLIVEAAGGRRLPNLDRGARRRMIIGTVMRMLPWRFDATAAGDLDARIGFNISDAAGGAPDAYELLIRDGRLRVNHHAAVRPGATLTIGAADLLRLASGSAAWPSLLGRGELVLSGDPFLALRVPGLLGLPARVET